MQKEMLQEIQKGQALQKLSGKKERRLILLEADNVQHIIFC
jgi:hypothetical protein